MMREVTLGQYYPADSIIHKLDPRVKLLGTLVFVITLFFPKSATAMCLAGGFLVVVVRLSCLKGVTRGVRPLVLIVTFSALVNLLFTPGDVIFRLGVLTITRQGLEMSVYLVVRLIFLIVGSSIMTYTTTPNQLTAGLETGLGFLTRFHIPVHEFAMMMSIALRFIPILTDELDKIMKAQMSRGIDFEEGNLLVRAKKLVPILIPLFISAFRRASDLAAAMEARCYHGGEGRTRLHPLKYLRRDYLAYGVLGMYFLAMVVLTFV